MDSMQFESFPDFYRNGAYAHCAQEYRKGGSFGIGMLEAEQPGGAYTDPAIPEISIVEVVDAPSVSRLDFGAGLRVHGQEIAGGIGPQPAGAECQLEMQGTHRVRALHLNEATFRSLTVRAGFRGDPLAAMYAEFTTDRRSSAAFHALWDATQHDDPSASLRVDGASLTFLALYLPTDGTDLAPDWLPGSEDMRMRRVLDYIEANLAEQLLMDELAAVACLSTSHFARVFRKSFGMTAHRFVTERRIERAKRELASTHDPVTLIAFECGFGSSARFATVFKQYVGVSPSQYRIQVN